MQEAVKMGLKSDLHPKNGGFRWRFVTVIHTPKTPAYCLLELKNVRLYKETQPQTHPS